jgi:predicted DNA-binding transcriptional regulator AlpA
LAINSSTTKSARQPVPQIYLNSAQVRSRYGGISQMSLWRWLHDPAMGFPQPLYFGRLRFWRLHALQQWERGQKNVGM